MTLKELLHGKSDSPAIQLVRSVAVSNVAFALDFALCLAFLIISFIGLALNALGMMLFTGLLRIHYLVSRVMAAILVFFSISPAKNS